MHLHPFATALPLPAHRPLTPSYTTKLPKRTFSDFARPSTAPPGSSSKRTANHASSSTRLRQNVTQRPSGRFLLQEGKVSVSLEGQVDGTSVPTYGQGSIVDGFVSVMNPSNVRAVECKIEGSINIKELAGGGSCRTILLVEQLAFWTGRECPPVIPFSTTLPIHYLDQNGERNELPPSFSDRLPGVPGFNCAVEYAITIMITRARDRTNLWRKNSILRIPLLYRPRTRPSHSGPFPAISTTSNSKPVTTFVCTIESKAPLVKPIVTHLYLPYSQICPISAPIPFYLKLSSSEQSLRPFTQFTPTLPSFHPLSSGDSAHSTSSLQSLQHQIVRATQPCPMPCVRVFLVRQVSVDAQNTGVCILGESRLYKDIILGEGVLHRAPNQQDSLVWVGEIRISQSLHTGGFHAINMTVQDVLVLSIKPPNPLCSPLKELRKIIPMRLTTDPYECHQATKVTDL